MKEQPPRRYQRPGARVDVATEKKHTPEGGLSRWTSSEERDAAILAWHDGIVALITRGREHGEQSEAERVAFSLASKLGDCFSFGALDAPVLARLKRAVDCLSSDIEGQEGDLLVAVKRIRYWAEQQRKHDASACPTVTDADWSAADPPLEQEAAAEEAPQEADAGEDTTGAAVNELLKEAADRAVELLARKAARAALGLAKDLADLDAAFKSLHLDAPAVSDLLKKYAADPARSPGSVGAEGILANLIVDHADGGSALGFIVDFESEDEGAREDAIVRIRTRLYKLLAKSRK